MIGLKKKQEEKKAAEAAEAALTAPNDSDVMEVEQPAAGAAAGRGRGRGTTASIWFNADKGDKKAATGRRLRPGEIRIQKDIQELDGGESAVARFPNKDDMMNFEVVIYPETGYWAGYAYTFKFQIPDMYPHEPPKVHCVEKVYHPNIDLEGNVCLNILRADWKPVLNINAAIYGLIYLFQQPNPEDPLNHEAAKCLRDNPVKFKLNVERSLRGMDADGVQFPPAVKAPPAENGALKVR